MEKYINIPKDAIYKITPKYDFYGEVDIINKDNKKIYNFNHPIGSLDLQKTIEELSLIELEACIFYFRGKFQEFFTGDFMAKDGQEYSDLLFKIAGLLKKLRTARDKKYNELSNIEKREHLLNLLQLLQLSIIECEERKIRK